MFTVTSTNRRGEPKAHEVKALEIIWARFPAYGAHNTVHVDDLARTIPRRSRARRRLPARAKIWDLSTVCRCDVISAGLCGSVLRFVPRPSRSHSRSHSCSYGCAVLCTSCAQAYADQSFWSCACPKELRHEPAQRHRGHAVPGDRRRAKGVEPTPRFHQICIFLVSSWAGRCHFPRMSGCHGQPAPEQLLAIRYPALLL